MKISPIAQGTGVPSAEIGTASTQRSSPDRIAAAKAVAAGQSPMRLAPSDNYVDPQVERAQNSIRKIKMRTNVSPDRFDLVENAQEQPESAIVDNNETTPEAEETKPLSPQFAALLKQKRALQVKESELLKREQELQSRASTDGSPDVISRLKSDPLSVLQEAGVTYDQLTEAILNGTPNPEIRSMQEKVEALEKALDDKFQSRDSAAEEAALTEMLYEAEALAKDGEAYPGIQNKNAFDRVLRHIHKTYKQTGRVLDVSEAMNVIEGQLRKEAESYASIYKFAPAQEIQAAQSQNRNPGMRTLTNKDTARPILGRRERMLAAFNGTLKR